MAEDLIDAITRQYIDKVPATGALKRFAREIGGHAMVR